MLALTTALSLSLTLPSASPSTKIGAAATAFPARREILTSGAGLAVWAMGARAASAEEEAAAPVAEVAPPPPPPPARVEVDKNWPKGLEVAAIKSGKKSEKPVVGDLVAIRFKCQIEKTGQVIDDIMESAEPYYYRAGSGQVVPAIEAAIVNMRAGDVWQLRVPPELGFGTKGRNASPGKPRIPGDAILIFTVALDQVPGKDEEIIEQNGIID